MASTIDSVVRPIPGAREAANEAPSGELTGAGTLVGTPYYMAPELWRGRPASRRSDIYSLGAMLFELCCGGTPTKELLTTGRHGEIAAHRAAPLREVATEVDPRFAAIIDRCLRNGPLERFSSGDELLHALEQVAAADRGVVLPEGNPYRGLEPFDAEHRSLFFGRNAEIKGVLGRLVSESFVVVIGDSGAGKSSLCRAGILPMIPEGALGGDRVWTVERMRPGRRPLAAIASAFAGRVGMPEESLANYLAVHPEVLAREMQRVQGKTHGVVLFVDQLEEILTDSDPAEAAAAATVLGELAADIPGVRLLATLRSDFLTRLAKTPKLGGELSRAIELLGPLSEAGIREAIVGPARAKGVRFEFDSLVDALVQSTLRAEGSLPLLQFALAELWEARDAGESIISLAALEAIGGVEGALARHADAVLGRLLPDERVAARRVLLRLVTADGTRARRTKEELCEENPGGAAALEALERGRLLSVRESGGDAIYEVAHEALISGWSALRGWLDEYAETSAARLRLEIAALEWERLGRSREALWGRSKLAEIRGLDLQELPPREADFIAASRRALFRRRVGERSILLGLPVLLVTVLGGLHIAAKQRESAAIQQSYDDAKRLLTDARGIAREAETFRGLTLSQLETGDHEIAERTWESARLLGQESDARYDRAVRTLDQAIARDGSRDELRSLYAITVAERSQAEARRSFDGLRWSQLLGSISAKRPIEVPSAPTREKAKRE